VERNRESNQNRIKQMRTIIVEKFIQKDLDKLKCYSDLYNGEIFVIYKPKKYVLYSIEVKAYKRKFFNIIFLKSSEIFTFCFSPNETELNRKIIAGNLFFDNIKSMWKEIEKTIKTELRK